VSIDTLKPALHPFLRRYMTHKLTAAAPNDAFATIQKLLYLLGAKPQIFDRYPRQEAQIPQVKRTIQRKLRMLRKYILLGGSKTLNRIKRAFTSQSDIDAIEIAMMIWVDLLDK
jgi:myo-inositol catabolism protein IolC